jgi:hypothetical protein
VVKDTSERVYANTFSVNVPDAIIVCDLTEEMGATDVTALRKSWAFVEADARTFLAFESPPGTVPVNKDNRLAAYDWRHYSEKYAKKSADVVKELVRRSLEVACVSAGLEWCDDLKDGRCRTCGSSLQIVDADHATMSVECTECGDSYPVETDAFGDGCMTYYAGFMASRMEGGGD